MEYASFPTDRRQGHVFNTHILWDKTADKKQFYAEYSLSGHTALGISRKVDKASKPRSSYHFHQKLGGMCAHPNR